MMTRLCGGLIIVALAFGSARAQDIPKGEAAFTQYVATQLQRAIQGETVKVEGPLTLGVAGLQANLDRIFAFCSRNSSGCANEVSNYVKAVAQTYKDRSAPPSKEAVRVVVRAQAYLAGAQSLPKPPKLAPRPLAGGFIMLPALDTPRAIRILSEDDNERLGLSSDDVFKLGLDNLRKHLKPLMSVAKVTQTGQIGQLSGDGYHSSRSARFESWAPLSKARGGRLTAAGPTTNAGINFGDDTPTGIEAFRLLAKNVSTRVPNPLSTELLRWTPARWEVVR